MSRIVDKWFVTPSTEIIVLSLAGIFMTLKNDESIMTTPDHLNEVLQSDYTLYSLSPFTTNLVKTSLCLVIIGRSITAPFYLISYVHVIWVAYFEKNPRWLLPWLFIGFFRHFVLDQFRIVFGLFLIARIDCTRSVVQFVVVKFVEMALYIYLWQSVMLLYRGLQLLDQPVFAEVLMETHLENVLRNDESCTDKPCMKNTTDINLPVRNTIPGCGTRETAFHKQLVCDASVQVKTRKKSKNMSISAVMN